MYVSIHSSEKSWLVICDVRTQTVTEGEDMKRLE